MNNMDKIKNTITFYTLANKLKTTIIDGINNYSVSDHLFGSMILAVAMDSEFKETNNVGKLLKMMVLDEFSKLNPDYNFNNNLNKGKKYQKEIYNARSLNSKDARLIFKYKMLDYSLTNFISKYENTLDYSDLIKYGVKIFKPEDVNKQ